MHWFGRISLLLNPSITSSTYTATLAGSKAVVLKSMTRRSLVHTNSRTNVTNLNETLSRLILDNSFSLDEPLKNVVLCPNINSLHLLFEKIDEDYANIVSERTLWLDIQTSIEPLLLKFFAGDDTVPVPKLYGTCGDVIVKEFKGNPLSEYFAEDYMKKFFISFQLLKMAEAFTFSHPSLIFYFTDISPYNIAVNSSGKASLIDLDHVIIAERRYNQLGDARHWKGVHVSTLLDPEHLAISPSDICAGSISDHNYFIICQHILMHSEDMKEGFLSNIPQSVRETYHDLLEALDECAVPKSYPNRIASGRYMTDILEGIVSGFEWNEL